MTRNFKALGVAAFALLALGAMVAPAAQAEVTLTSGATPSTHTAATVHAVQIEPVVPNITTHTFTSGIGIVTCSNALSTFTGTTTGTDKTLTINANYVHCNTITASDTAGTPVTVTMNGCHYIFNQPTAIAGGKYTGTVNLICPVNKKVEIEVYAAGTVTAHSVKVCTLSIGEQKGIPHVVYQNTSVAGKKDDVDVTVTATNSIPYATSGTCGVTSGNASYSSELTLTSTNHDLWISG